MVGHVGPAGQAPQPDTASLASTMLLAPDTQSANDVASVDSLASSFRNMMKKEKKNSVSEGATDAKKVTVEIDGKRKKTVQKKPVETTKLVSYFICREGTLFSAMKNLVKF